MSSLAKNIAKSHPTFPRSEQDLAKLADQVRKNFNSSDSFRGDLWDRPAAAWAAAGWATAAAAYGTATWDDCSSYGGYSSQPNYYDYGSQVAYQGDNVYSNGDQVATQGEYAQQAATIADKGKQARASRTEDWLPLGVFAMVLGEQISGKDLFQLALNKSGVIRGNYYNALSDETLPVYGSVDKKTQRAAWTIGDRKEPIFDAGLANLTRPQTTMLVHSKGRAQQWTSVRMEQPESEK